MRVCLHDDQSLRLLWSPKLSRIVFDQKCAIQTYDVDYGSHIWPASLLLAEYLTSVEGRALIEGQRVLEVVFGSELFCSSSILGLLRNPLSYLMACAWWCVGIP